MEAKAYLRKVYRLDELIAGSKKELEDLKVLVEGIPNFERAGEEKESLLMSVEKMEEAIRKDIAQMLALKLEVRGVINAVEDPEERLLLYERYMNFYTWDEICDKMNVSMRTVQRIHSSALSKVKVPS